MAMLGDILSLARSSSGDFQRWLEAHDTAMAQDVTRAAEAERESFTTFTRTAVADFSRFASEEDWASLMSRLRDSDNPGSACLEAMVHWRIARAIGTGAGRGGRDER